LGAPSALDSADIMAGREAIRVQLMGEPEQVGEFRAHIAADAGDGGAAAQIFVGETVDHIGAEARFMVEHIMGNAEPVADGAGIADVAAGAAASGAPDRLAMIIKLERDADRLGAGRSSERSYHRAVD